MSVEKLHQIDYQYRGQKITYCPQHNQWFTQFHDDVLEEVAESMAELAGKIDHRLDWAKFKFEPFDAVVDYRAKMTPVKVKSIYEYGSRERDELEFYTTGGSVDHHVAKATEIYVPATDNNAGILAGIAELDQQIDALQQARNNSIKALTPCGYAGKKAELMKEQNDASNTG